MGLKNQFCVGLLAGACLVSCAGASFPYRYYALDAQSYDGFLRGDKPENDLKLSECTPTVQDKAPCVVFKTNDAIKLKLEYKDMQNRLKKCGG